jgi:hypothetical protein
MESLWIVIDIAGPLLLIVAIIWLTLRGRKDRREHPEKIAAGEQGARNLRRQLDEEEAARGDP